MQGTEGIETGSAGDMSDTSIPLLHEWASSKIESRLSIHLSDWVGPSSRSIHSNPMRLFSFQFIHRLETHTVVSPLMSLPLPLHCCRDNRTEQSNIAACLTTARQ